MTGKKREEQYLKELQEICERYAVDPPDLEKVRRACETELPITYIQNAEKAQLCLEQKEYCDFLFHKLFDELEEYHLNHGEDCGRITVDGEEEDWRHKLTPDTRTPRSIYEMYGHRSNESPRMIRALLNQLRDYSAFFAGEARGQIKGDQGEENVRKYFSMFAGKYPFRMNVVLPVKDEFARSSELDSVIVTSKGIFVCEIKNWGNEREDIYIERDDTWYVCGQHKREKKKNPFEQNIRHTFALEKYLEANGITCRLIPVVVIADSRTAIRNESGKTVLKASAVYEYIQNQLLPDTIDAQTQEKILGLLDHTGAGANAFPCKDFFAVSDVYEEAIDAVLRIRDVEYRQEQALFGQCESIIKKYDRTKTLVLLILFLLLGILAIAGIIAFRGVIKVLIGLALLGIVCGGLASK